ncbi:CBS domain-containing protein [Muricoccus radiodurans]|uniref:CBS domain-containing protein n=1 Tax=Muricoccus radiodurans TaxID=2231721 RepID=UPI003CEF4ED8
MTIATILRGKGSHVISVLPGDRAREVARTLTRHRIGAVLVRDPDGRVLGIVSERDIVRAFATAGELPVDLPAEEMMTRSLATVTPGTKITEALALMTDRRVRHLPVLEDGVLCGMVSIGDLVKARIDAAVAEAEALKEYVATA